MGIAIGVANSTSFAATVLPTSFPDGCPAPGALQFVCVPANAISVSTTSSSSNTISNSAINQLFPHNQDDSSIANHTVRQAQDLALGLVLALQKNWGRLTPIKTNNASTPVIVSNSNFLAAAMVGNALILNPCMNVDQQDPGRAAFNHTLGMTSSNCDNRIKPILGIGLAKLTTSLYDKPTFFSPDSPLYYLNFLSKIPSQNNYYRVGSAQDSLFYLTFQFATRTTTPSLYYLKTPLSQLTDPSGTALLFSNVDTGTKTLDQLSASNPNDMSYAVATFASFQSMGIGQCLNAAPQKNGGKTAPPPDPCSLQCRVDAANRVLGWMQQSQQLMNGNGGNCVEPPPPPPPQAAASSTSATDNFSGNPAAPAHHAAPTMLVR